MGWYCSRSRQLWKRCSGGANSKSSVSPCSLALHPPGATTARITVQRAQVCCSSKTAEPSPVSVITQVQSGLQGSIPANRHQWWCVWFDNNENAQLQQVQRVPLDHEQLRFRVRSALLMSKARTVAWVMTPGTVALTSSCSASASWLQALRGFSL